MKADRHSAILSIIAARPIATQQQLQQALLQRGICCTQGTLSRDIKELHLVKYPAGDGTLRYAAESSSAQQGRLQALNAFFRQGITGFQLVENMIVVKTLPGYASGVASYFDHLSLPDVLGTLAGNDTVLMVVADEKCARSLYNKEFKSLL